MSCFWSFHDRFWLFNFHTMLVGQDSMDFWVNVFDNDVGTGFKNVISISFGLLFGYRRRLAQTTHNRVGLLTDRFTRIVHTYSEFTCVSGTKSGGGIN